jgi:hypothetical protein
MQQAPLITYADIAEVRKVPGAAACNQLLAEGWVLLGIYPLTIVVGPKYFVQAELGSPCRDPAPLCSISEGLRSCKRTDQPRVVLERYCK